MNLGHKENPDLSNIINHNSNVDHLLDSLDTPSTILTTMNHNNNSNNHRTTTALNNYNTSIQKQQQLQVHHKNDNEGVVEGDEEEHHEDDDDDNSQVEVQVEVSKNGVTSQKRCRMRFGELIISPTIILNK